MFRSDKTAEYAASLLGGKVARRENDYYKLNTDTDEVDGVANQRSVGSDVINDAFFVGLL